MTRIIRPYRWFAVLVAVLLAMLALAGLPARVVQATPAVDERFRAYYEQHEGMRVLGYPLTELLWVDGVPAQYFEKGRLEDHRASVSDPNWVFMYGRLTAELMERNPSGSANSTDATYLTLRHSTAPEHRHTPPAGFTGGVMTVPLGVFVPYDAHLRPAPGYIVPTYFWDYLNRTDLFPGGWLHDIGLPMTDAFAVETVKSGQRRLITMQAFERAALTYDPQNPAAWQVERGNIGTDALRVRQSGEALQAPAAGERATLPLHILARVGEPGQMVTATLRWSDGTTRTATLTALAGEDGRGLVIGTPPWFPDVPPQPATQPARLQLHHANGQLLAEQQLTLLAPDDPDVTTVQLYWVVTTGETEQVRPQVRHVVRTPRIGSAALEELLWGPPQPTQIGFQTAIPTPAQVLGFPGREADWGPRVTLRGLTIENGVATADFSQEMRAYGGGSLRVKLIRDQISQTLRQFPTVREVRIAIEGETEAVLEP